MEDLVLIGVLGGIIASLYLLSKKKQQPQCYTDADCPQGYVCINGICVPGQPADISVEFTLFNITKTAEGVDIDVNAHIESNPNHIDYASIDILIDNALYYGECWSDHPEVPPPGCKHPSDVYAPVDIGFTLSLIIEGVHKYQPRCYARNINERYVDVKGPIITA